MLQTTSISVEALPLELACKSCTVQPWSSYADIGSSKFTELTQVDMLPKFLTKRRAVGVEQECLCAYVVGGVMAGFQWWRLNWSP